MDRHGNILAGLRNDKLFFFKHNDHRSQPLLRQDWKCRLWIGISDRIWKENLNTTVLFFLQHYPLKHSNFITIW